MGQVFHRNPKHKYPVAVGGDGPYVIDRDGKRYLDACGGAAVSCLRHSDREVIDAIKAQLDQLPLAHSSFFTNKPMEGLACDHVVLAPPYVISEAQLDEIVDKLGRSIDRVIAAE
jgi:adenosylmethionine-8-amino-7-oxononanoate aminotransferase